MQTRIDDHQAPPGAAKAMLELQQDVDTCGIEPALVEGVCLIESAHKEHQTTWR
jgi:hypothetical protein